MKSKKVLVLAMMITLLTSIFAMSDDGGNEPNANKKEVKSEASQVEKPMFTEQAKQAKSNEIVKDRLGVNTGMTKDELLNFKREYLKQAELLGINKGRRIAPGSYYKYKINIKAVKELKKLGLFLTKDPFMPEESFAYKVTHSDIIVIGTVARTEHFYETEEEEWKAKPGAAKARDFIEVDKILRGQECLKVNPDTISVLSSTGKFLTDGFAKLRIGEKYLLFLNTISVPLYKNDFSQIRNSALGLDGDQIYFNNFECKHIMDKDEVISKIKKYEEINNSDNFYKRKYNIKEDNNEK